MILLNFNNRNDNFGDQLISYLLHEELRKKNSVYYINSKPEIVDAIPLRIREVITAIIFRRLKGEKVLLIDPPCARVHIEKLANASFKKRVIEFILKIIISERHVLSVSIDSRLNPDEFKIYNSIGVRDTPSLTFVKKHHNNVWFTPDMACLLPTKKPNHQGNKTIVSFRETTPDNNYSTEYSEKIKLFLTKIFEALKTHTHPQQIYFYSQVEEDDKYNSDLSLKTNHHSNILKIDKHKKELYYQELFNNCQYVISNRLHVLLPAMINGILTIALLSRTHNKIIDLLTTYGLDKTIVYVDSETNIQEDIEQILLNKNAILIDQYEKLVQLNLQLKKYIDEF